MNVQGVYILCEREKNEDNKQINFLLFFLSFLSLYFPVSLLKYYNLFASQTTEFAFNKGVLFNAAYRESQKEGNFTCFVMQDADLIPMDNRNLYRCGDLPRHLVLTRGQTKWMKKSVAIIVVFFLFC